VALFAQPLSRNEGHALAAVGSRPLPVGQLGHPLAEAPHHAVGSSPNVEKIGAPSSGQPTVADDGRPQRCRHARDYL
jgi:hypothetical protein